MIDKKRESTNRNYQKLHPERIMVSIVGGLKFHVDQVHGGIRASNVDKLKSKERKRNVHRGCRITLNSLNKAISIYLGYIYIYIQIDIYICIYTDTDIYIHRYIYIYLLYISSILRGISCLFQFVVFAYMILQFQFHAMWWYSAFLSTE